MTAYALRRRRTAWHLPFARGFVAGFALVMLVVVLVAGWHAAARAHGDAAWIMQNPETAWCCNPTDCAQLPDGAVERLAPGEWRIRETGQVFREGQTGVYPAKRAGYWACRRPHGYICFFYEAGGY